MPEWEERWPWSRLKFEKEAREEFIKESLAFIRHTACQACHRTLEWGRDEELSEAMIAFNEAIDHYEPEREVPFLAYARVLMKRRLIDYYRRQRNKEAISLDKDEVGQVVDIHLGLNEFREKEQVQERAAEIREYAKELSKYQLAFSDLVEVSPKHRDSRETLLRAARELAFDKEMWEQVERKGKIPMTSLALKTQLHPKVLERGRKYILAVAVLIAKQNDFVYLREYVLPPERGIIAK